MRGLIAFQGIWSSLASLGFLVGAGYYFCKGNMYYAIGCFAFSEYLALMAELYAQGRLLRDILEKL